METARDARQHLVRANGVRRVIRHVRDCLAVFVRSAGLLVHPLKERVLMFVQPAEGNRRNDVEQALEHLRQDEHRRRRQNAVENRHPSN